MVISVFLVRVLEQELLSSALCYACWPVRFWRLLQPVGVSQPFAQGRPSRYDFLEVCFHVLVEAVVAAPGCPR